MVFWNEYGRDVEDTHLFLLKKWINIYIFSYQSINECIAKRICNFLRMYFGNPPYSPVLNIPTNDLISKDDIIIYVKSKYIIGCIRYRYIGKYKDSSRYIVDCFCIHPKWRKRGIGDYLLIKLREYANKNNKSLAIFLKEGNSLSITSFPIYTGRYVYSEIIKTPSLHVIDCDLDKAYKLLSIYQSILQIFVIADKKVSNQQWKLYNKDTYYILVCIQDTYQSINCKKIGWITGWLESPNITNKMREEASYEIINTCTNYEYIWMNEEWTGYSKKYKKDGLFHYYVYQWSVPYMYNSSYCILN